MKPQVKKLSVLAVTCLTTLAVIAQTIIWYSDAPPVTTISDTDVIAIETSGPQGYKSATMLQIKNYAGGVWVNTGGIIHPVTNNPVATYLDKSTNSANSLAVSAILMNSTNANVEGRASVNTVLSGGAAGPKYSGNASLSGLNGANSASIDISASALTNKSTAVITGTTNGEVAFTLSQDGLDTTGRVNAVTYTTPTNDWTAGPTGAVNMVRGEHYLLSPTACEITGLLNRSNNVLQTTVITLTNSQATNWLLTLAAGIKIPQRTNQVVCSNASQITLTLRYHPKGGTNGVVVQF